MSILPPTDIVTEVAQAADPHKLHAAMTRLADLTATLAPNEHFSALLKGAAVEPPLNGADHVSNGSKTSVTHLALGGMKSLASSQAGEPRASDVAKRFEAYVIQSFLQTLLPQEEHGIFGQGTAGGVWRSMTAEQLGNQLAKAGGVGLRKILERHWAERGAHVAEPASRTT